MIMSSDDAETDDATGSFFQRWQHTDRPRLEALIKKYAIGTYHLNFLQKGILSVGTIANKNKIGGNISSIATASSGPADSLVGSYNVFYQTGSIHQHVVADSNAVFDNRSIFARTATGKLEICYQPTSDDDNGPERLVCKLQLGSNSFARVLEDGDWQWFADLENVSLVWEQEPEEDAVQYPQTRPFWIQEPKSSCGATSSGNTSAIQFDLSSAPAFSQAWFSCTGGAVLRVLNSQVELPWTPMECFNDDDDSVVDPNESDGLNSSTNQLFMERDKPYMDYCRNALFATTFVNKNQRQSSGERGEQQVRNDGGQIMLFSSSWLYNHIGLPGPIVLHIRSFSIGFPTAPTLALQPGDVLLDVSMYSHEPPDHQEFTNTIRDILIARRKIG